MQAPSEEAGEGMLAGSDPGAETVLQRNTPVHLLVSTGASGTLVMYEILPGNASAPVAQLSLSYLIRNGDLNAGRIMLYGQTLYVASGQGDVQMHLAQPRRGARGDRPARTEIHSGDDAVLGLDHA